MADHRRPPGVSGRVRAGVVGAALVLAAGSIASAAADELPSIVSRSGDCSGPSHWRLAVRASGTNLRIRYAVAGGAPDQRWNVFADRNGAFLFAVLRRSGDGGRFRVTRVVADPPGVDRIHVRALNVRTGEVCRSGIAI
jgi:hypothetical protein